MCVCVCVCVCVPQTLLDSPDAQYAFLTGDHVRAYDRQCPSGDVEVAMSRITLVNKANEMIEELYTQWGRVPVSETSSLFLYVMCGFKCNFVRTCFWITA